MKIEQMINRLNKGIKNPSRYLYVADGAYIKWSDKEGIQTMTALLVKGFKDLEEQVVVLNAKINELSSPTIETV